MSGEGFHWAIARLTGGLVGLRAAQRANEFATVEESRSLLRYPTGWYAVCFSDEVPSGKVVRRPFFGEDVVVYRTSSGVLRAIRPYCPHFGAHLGIGGRVEGEAIVCPFHGFRYGGDGRCVGTPHGEAPPAARLTALPAREVNDIVLVWFHPKGTDPGWEVPAVAMRGFPRAAHRTFVIRDHPQEIMENNFDLTHFPVVHGVSLRTVKEACFGEHSSSLTVEVERELRNGSASKVEIENNVHGLGVLQSTITAPGTGTRGLSWALATPIDRHRVAFTIATSFLIEQDAPLPKLLRGKARPALSALLSRIALEQACRTSIQDFPIWTAKKYLPKPKVLAEERIVIDYRRWARQFCDEDDAAEATGS
ncbi:Rieske 2Fe-2S domain-containing protein [Amycolatopsis rubida]|uniref:cholesterol 7-desaturase n=1 Tax=Amycolatopsis rubida TaxID=112413 RepID=A0A1I5TKW5_9PSEU|nr:Rieske 2Fe-2S domain-containing protein [Amycolatopsis rubida]SFP83709.1 Phenylpropionate dioxygenase, large terminal subunit [Amycolatopsis rubida]